MSRLCQNHHMCGCTRRFYQKGSSFSSSTSNKAHLKSPCSHHCHSRTKGDQHSAEYSPDHTQRKKYVHIQMKGLLLPSHGTGNWRCMDGKLIIGTSAEHILHLYVPRPADHFTYKRMDRDTLPLSFGPVFELICHLLRSSFGQEVTG